MRSMGHFRDQRDPSTTTVDGFMSQVGVRFTSRSSGRPPSMDWAPNVKNMVEQVGESCVGQAIIQGGDVLARNLGRPLPWGSAFSVWTPARASGGLGLEDNGVFPADALECVRSWGYCTEARWPSTAANIRRELPFDVIRAGADAHITHVTRIRESGEARCDLIRDLIAAGYPVIFAMHVDLRYMRLKPQAAGDVIFDGIDGGVEGSHMQVLVGYKPGVFKVCNSWGKNWANHGFVWLPDDFVGGDHAYDFTAIDTVPGALR